MSFKPSHLFLPLLLVLGVAACSGPASDGNMGSESQSVSESKASLESRPAVDQAAVGMSDPSVALRAPPCPKSEKVGRALVGSVFRKSAAIQEDGIGTLLLLVVDLNPAESGSREDNTACQVATVRYANVNLNDEEGGHPFEIPGVPARVEPYFVVAIFDDDGSLPKSGAPRLAKGDLVATLGGNCEFPSVVVSEDPEILLNLNVDFLYNADPQGMARLEGDWVSAPGPEAEGELDSAGKGPTTDRGASLTVEAESLTFIVDGEKEVLSYVITEGSKGMVLTSTDSTGQSKSVAVTFSKEGMMTWSKSGGPNSAESVRWRRK